MTNILACDLVGVAGGIFFILMGIALVLIAVYMVMALWMEMNDA